jgi:hypothetical protein
VIIAPCFFQKLQREVQAYPCGIGRLQDFETVASSTSDIQDVTENIWLYGVVTRHAPR